MPQSARYWRATGGYQDATILAPAFPPARTWRANGGYQDVKKASFPPQQAAMYWPPWYCTQWAGQQYVRCPVPVDGVYQYPQMIPPPWYGQYGRGNAGGTPPPPYMPVPTPPVQEGKKKDEKTEEKKDEKIENLDAPPKLDEGVNYMFDKRHTMLHIFSRAAPIWEEKYRKEDLKFKMFKTPASFTPKLVIEKVRKEGNDCKGWAVTEAHERGGGVWAKGMTIKYDSDKASNLLPKFGWSTKRGDALPPVWLVVHKV